ncbi:MAG: chemotaxis protein CheD [Desulfamplus sp.]|nr:chemotaxis protein CheD [Desulfamplus sp.]MBF0389541.1 chemotaxis protein CheD [Desulfamplus sp.]
MNKHDNTLIKLDYLLKPGFIYLADKPISISTVVGSSVAISLFDKKNKIGGMNHFQFPEIRDKELSTALYGNVATITLIKMMLSNGSKEHHIEAHIFGGAHNPEVSKINVGLNNIKTARRILNSKQIKIVSEDVGGEVGRKIIFNTSTSEIAVLKVKNLRRSDWYPYEGDR